MRPLFALPVAFLLAVSSPLFAAFGLAASGCGSPRPVTAASSAAAAAPAPSMSDIEFGEPFTLEHRASALVAGHRLRFDTIVEESRCPTNTTCVWEGRAVISLTFTGEQSVGEVRLTIPGYVTAESAPAESQSAAHGGYVFTLLALDPYPGAAEGDGSTPTATLSVEEAGGAEPGTPLPDESVIVE